MLFRSSLAPTLQGKSLPARQIFIEHEGNRSVRDGDWKLVGLSGKPWELYNLKSDPTEMQNLASKESTRVAALAGAWDAWAARCSVVEKNKPAKDTTTPLAAIPTPQIAQRALTIQCELVAESRDGVVLAQGGQQNGYALHLKDGKLVFSLRSAKQLTAIQASDALPVAVKASRASVGITLLALRTLLTLFIAAYFHFSNGSPEWVGSSVVPHCRFIIPPDTQAVLGLRRDQCGRLARRDHFTTDQE